GRKGWRRVDDKVDPDFTSRRRLVSLIGVASGGMVRLTAAVTVDLIVLTVREDRLHVLVIERGIEPYPGEFALPGGFILDHEDTGEAALRELAEETSLD